MYALWKRGEEERRWKKTRDSSLMKLIKEKSIKLYAGLKGEITWKFKNSVGESQKERIFADSRKGLLVWEIKGLRVWRFEGFGILK